MGDLGYLQQGIWVVYVESIGFRAKRFRPLRGSSFVLRVWGLGGFGMRVAACLV